MVGAQCHSQYQGPVMALPGPAYTLDALLLLHVNPNVVMGGGPSIMPSTGARNCLSLALHTRTYRQLREGTDTTLAEILRQGGDDRYRELIEEEKIYRKRQLKNGGKTLR